MMTPMDDLRKALLLEGLRTNKPRRHGLTMLLDKGLGIHEISDLIQISSQHLDYAKIAWGSSLISGCIEEKIEAYRKGAVEPVLGGTLFEIAYLRGKVEELLAFIRETKIHLEISDGVAEVPRKEKLSWIERFSAVAEVFSEVGGKTAQKSDHASLVEMIKEEKAAGAKKVVVEGREIGPVGKDIQTHLVDEILEAIPKEELVFEALDRPQQVWMIKKIGSNVNLGNILPRDVLTLESFRQGLKEHTLLHINDKMKASA